MTDDISENDITCKVEEDCYNFLKNHYFNDNSIRLSNILLIKKENKKLDDVRTSKYS